MSRAGKRQTTCYLSDNENVNADDNHLSGPTLGSVNLARRIQGADKKHRGSKTEPADDRRGSSTPVVRPDRSRDSSQHDR